MRHVLREMGKLLIPDKESSTWKDPLVSELWGLWQIESEMSGSKLGRVRIHRFNCLVRLRRRILEAPGASLGFLEEPLGKAKRGGDSSSIRKWI